MNNKKKSYLKNVLLALVLLGGCATASTANGLPGWVQNPGSKYPDALYLTAVGSGSSMEAAKRKAMSSLSSIFSVDVKLDRRILEVYAEEKKGEKTGIEHSVNLITESVLKSENELINTRIGETYFDEKTGTFYVLAYINRAETELIYREEIKKNDKLMLNYYDAYAKEEDKLDKLVYLKKAVQIASIGQGLRQMHRIISQMDDTPNMPIPMEQLRMELQELASKIKVDISIKGEFVEEVSSYLREVVVESGLSPGGENADMRFEASVKLVPLEFPRKEKFVKWNLIIDVENILRGTTMDTYTREGREGHVSAVAARNRALRSIKDVIKNDFYLKFNRFLSSAPHKD